MSKINGIILHHSASNFGDAGVINRWHIERGWRGIGYHYVILNGYRSGSAYGKKRMDCVPGAVEKGRPLDEDSWISGNEIGSHALGLNSSTIGICMIHLDDYYAMSQLKTAVLLIAGLCVMHSIPPEFVKGHSEVDKRKPECPGVNMEWFRNEVMEKMRDREFVKNYALRVIRGEK